MPELPEVETIRRDLESEIVGLKFTDVKFLWNKTLKEVSEKDFRQKILNQKIVSIDRRAKNLAIILSNHYAILMHMKMTGHLLIETASHTLSDNGSWQSPTGSLADPLNQFIRTIFWLDNGKIMAFSDLRKFGYIRLLNEDDLKKIWDGYGPEPFSEQFNAGYLTNLFKTKKQAVKKVLMDQDNIAGIGNIYADEILWATKIHPLTPADQLSQKQIESIVAVTQDILQKAIKLRGTSSSDYRDTKGNKGKFEEQLQAYRRTGQDCARCHQAIERISVGGRGTHFCPNCQPLEEA